MLPCPVLVLLAAHELSQLRRSWGEAREEVREEKRKGGVHNAINDSN
jgi:hypothetical protein